jgi:hypothetical protein
MDGVAWGNSLFCIIRNSKHWVDLHLRVLWAFSPRVETGEKRVDAGEHLVLARRRRVRHARVVVSVRRSWQFGLAVARVEVELLVLRDRPASAAA